MRLAAGRFVAPARGVGSARDTFARAYLLGTVCPYAIAFDVVAFPFPKQRSWYQPRRGVCVSRQHAPWRHGSASYYASAAVERFPTTTKAVVFDKHGRPGNVLRVDTNFPVPTLGPDDVLVRWKVATVNPSDINVVEGTYPVLPKRFPAVGGNEAVGEVVKFGVGVGIKSLVGGDYGIGGQTVGDTVGDGELIKVIPDVPGLGTWREFAVVPAEKLRVVPTHINDELLAQLCVNLPTALRLLQDFVDLRVDFSASPAMEKINKNANATVALNAPSSAVGRAVLQICSAYGVPVVCSLRGRVTEKLWLEDAAALKLLGATLVVKDDLKRGGFRTNEVKELLKNLPPVLLALNCVGGDSSLLLASVLSEDGTIVTYGNMGRAPVYVPTGAAIFKNITAKGFWLTRWNARVGEIEAKKKRWHDETETDENGEGSPVAFSSDRQSPRSSMYKTLLGMIDRELLRMPLQRLGLDGFVETLNSAAAGRVGGGKSALWMP